jgi:hypothetical protein
MAIRKPAFITKQIRGGRPTTTRPYKWAPGIPSLAIQFEEIPGESLPKQDIVPTEPVLGTQDLFAITTQDGFYIEIIPT